VNPSVNDLSAGHLGNSEQALIEDFRVSVCLHYLTGQGQPATGQSRRAQTLLVLSQCLAVSHH
jgi:hypothetical protein